MKDARTYTVKEVAKLLGFSTNTVYKYLVEGKIRSTRFGQGGRFRIPEEEVIRLVGEIDNSREFSLREKISPVQEVSPIQTNPEDLSSKSNNSIANNLNGQDKEQNLQYKTLRKANDSIEEADSLEETDEKVAEDPTGNNDGIEAIVAHIYNPDIFDWFIALNAIFLGASYFLFPYSMQNVAFEPYRQIVFILSIALVGFGLVVILLRLFVPPKHYSVHIFSGFIIAFIFGSITYIYFDVGAYWTMTYFGTLAIFSSISSIPAFRSPLRLIFFIYLLITSSGIAFARNPVPYLTFGDIRYFIHNNPGVFEILLVSISTVILVLAIFSYFRIKSLFYVVSLFLFFLFLLVSFDFVISQSWNRAVVALLSGCFVLLLPFEKHSDIISSISRRQIFLAFIWFVAVTTMGIGLIFVMQMSFEKFSFEKSSSKALLAKEIVDSFSQDSINYVRQIALDPKLTNLLSAYSKDRENFTQDDLDELKNLNRQMFLGSTALRRLVVFDSTIEGISLYPPLNGSTALGRNISALGQDFLTRSKLEKRTFVTTAIQPPSLSPLAAAVYVVSPVVDDDGNVVGVLSGGLDLNKLYARLRSNSDDDSSYYVIADKNRTIISHPDTSFLGKELQQNNGLVKSINGETGSSLEYSQKGDLIFQSYTPIKSLGWSVSVNEPYQDAYKKPSMLSFGVFLMVMALGSGGLLAAGYSIRKSES